MTESVKSDPWVARLKDADSRNDALSDLRVRLVRGLRKAFSSTDENFAEDIAQDTLIRVLEKLNQFQGRSQFTTWAMSIAVRLATSQLRRKHFQDVSLNEFTGGDGLRIDVAGETPDAADAVERDALHRKLHELIDGLSDRQQTAVRALLGGMPVEEIASRTDSNRNAVYKLVHDARMRLKTGLESAGFSAADVIGSGT